MTSDDTETRNDKNEDASKNYGYPPQEDKSSWIRLNTKILTLRFNPVVFFGSVLILWSVVLCSLILQDKMPFGDLLSWITEKWTWLYISSQNLWFLFIVYLYFSKYGKIKLGKDTDEPEFSTATWFTMLFACGIGIGLFYFSVYETITHYTGNNRMTRDPSIPDNTLAQMALNVTLFHWGVHGWVVYTLVGALLGIISFREGLPLTIKSCFYPLIGERIYGWIGDLVDIISVIISVWGICPSLALGAIQINSGIRYLIPSFESTIFNQVMLIWAITIFATASTVSGTHLGIRRISEFCFLLGMFIMLVVLFYRNTFYILNLYVQSIGFYFQWIIQLGFHCDAFEQEISSGGGAADRNRILKGGDYETSDGPMDWMDNWTVFYWGWWIAWCPLVGMFVAKISKGRTLREFINGTMSAPLLYTFLWMSIFGATGIQIERQAASAGLCCKPDFNLVTLNNSIETFDLSSTSLAGYNPNYVCNSTKCNDCANTAIGKLGSKATYKTLYYKFKENPKFTEVSDDAKLTRLSCRKSEEMWFDTMHTMGDLGNAMHVISLVGIVLYFVTSSDSASLVVDTLSANGDAHPPRAQRIFWALTEGASATALLVGGGRNAIVGLQSLATASGLPYTFVLTYFCLSLYRVLQVTCGDKVPNPPTFKIGVLDGFSSPKVPYFLPDIYILLKSILNIFTAPWSIAQTAAALYGPMYRIPFFSVSVVLLMFSVGLPFGMFFVDGAGSLALTAYCAWCTVVCGMRIAVRNKCGYDANVMEDVGAAFLVYPCVTLQMYEEIPQITSTKGDKTSEQKMTSWDSSSFPFEKKEHPVEQVNGNHPGYAPNDKHNVYSNPQFQTGFHDFMGQFNFCSINLLRSTQLIITSCLTYLADAELMGLVLDGSPPTYQILLKLLNMVMKLVEKSDILHRLPRFMLWAPTVLFILFISTLAKRFNIGRHTYADDLQDDMPFGDLLSWITEKWTWLYISSQNLWFLFIVYLYFSKYANVKLGKDTDEPEFSTVTWFTMLFACGIGIGLFYFSVYETITHYTGNNRMTRDPSIPDNTLAQMALNLTLFHWGVHGWVVYCLVGALLGIISFREGFPLTIKSCFYPLIGERIYGWIGDLIDIISVVISIWAVCPGLALGVIQINSGIQFLFPTFETKTSNQVILIWVVTIIATASTVSGTHLGIRRISEFCFLLGMFIMLVVLFYRNTFYILNLYVQSIGFYFQWIIQLGFHCDAFEQEISSRGGAADRNRILKGGDYETSDGPMDWMDNWTVFYWGWWIAWCPLVGMFIAKISKGRTLREFINGTMSAPLLYSFLWMCIFGATGIQIERQAASAGLCCNPDFNLETLNYSIVTFDLNSTPVSGYNPNYVCNSTKCNDCAKTAIEKLGATATYEALYLKFKENPKFTEVSEDGKLTRLSCRKSEEMWFDTMHTLGDLGDSMHIISLFGIVLYFVTSSDSASLIVDTMSANGDPHPPTIQRIFWALTEGASATALLVGGGRNALIGLQSLATASGLLYTFVLTYFCLSLYRVLQVTSGDQVANPPTFKIGVLDGFSSPKVPYFLPDIYILLKAILNIFIAPWSIAQTAAALYGPIYIIPFFVVSLVVLLLSAGLPFGMLFIDGAGSLALCAFCAWCTIVCGMRIAVRNKCGYDANVMEDIGAAFLLYPCVTLQLYEEIPQIPKGNNDKNSKKEMTSIACTSFPHQKQEHQGEKINEVHPGYDLNNKPNGISNPQFQTGF